MSPPEPNSPPRAAARAAIQLDCAQATHPGLDPTKQVNEDSAGYAETSFGHLFVVCDGMGGHAGGRQASELAIRTIFEVVGKLAGQRRGREALREAIEEAARRVYRLGGPPTNLYRPGSTCVALLLGEGRVETAHVGDSRAFGIRGQRIFRLTRDHSLVQDLIDSGALTETQAIGHPDANKITRALGMTPEVEVELRPEPMELFPGDVFLLATDGLTDLVTTDDILGVTLDAVEAKGAQAVCDRLVSLANERGGHDNITVQVVRVRSTGSMRANTLQQEPGVLGDGPRPAAEGASGRPPADREGTVPDDTGPTVVDPTHPGGEPGAGRGDAMSPIAPAPPGPTVLQKPRIKGVTTTAPDRPLPTVVDPSLATEPVVPPPIRPLEPARNLAPSEPFPLDDRADGGPEGLGNRPLLMAVLLMAVVIGVLVVALAWVAYTR
jgi:PPM family protein phosphatase